MEKLQNNWLTEGLIDFEYKKYLLLAYLQNAKKKLSQKKLYPLLSDLIFHYQNLQKIKENKQVLYENFPKQITKADFQKLKLTYEKIVEDDESMKELEDIILYAMPRIKAMMENGKEIYEYIDTNLELTTVGIFPLYTDEGYFFLEQYNSKTTLVFKYQITIFTQAQEKFRGISTTHIESVRRGLGQTFESLKLDLIKRYKHLPNPGTFAAISKVPCPLEESLLPVAQRKLVREISNLAA
ncbi:hypothetical protein R9C00_14585 [Flammeovirgaceae bacterium SG7u.111]|nr:hypothetical protein [Flammeovirgaceae bacterium SG7u.132]WPO38685.1 hypothetical protein R9C00_14585 [Flammeovirgaceae bacterium SG7u.111]